MTLLQRPKLQTNKLNSFIITGYSKEIVQKQTCSQMLSICKKNMWKLLITFRSTAQYVNNISLVQSQYAVFSTAERITMTTIKIVLLISNVFML